MVIPGLPSRSNNPKSSTNVSNSSSADPPSPSSPHKAPVSTSRNRPSSRNVSTSYASMGLA